MDYSNKTPMTIARAAEFSGYTQRHLYRLIKIGKLRAYRPNGIEHGRVFVCKEELQEMIFGSPLSVAACDAEVSDMAAAHLAGE